MLLAADEHDL